MINRLDKVLIFTAYCFLIVITMLSITVFMPFGFIIWLFTGKNYPIRAIDWLTDFNPFRR